MSFVPYLELLEYDLSQLSGGWNPAPDLLTRKYDRDTSLVFGRVWRYCHGKRGYREASVYRIGDDLNMSYKTVESNQPVSESPQTTDLETVKDREDRNNYKDRGKNNNNSPSSLSETEIQELIDYNSSHIRPLGCNQVEYFKTLCQKIAKRQGIAGGMRTILGVIDRQVERAKSDPQRYKQNHYIIKALESVFYG